LDKKFETFQKKEKGRQFIEIISKNFGKKIGKID
jgi:hypothetical protein